MVYNSSRELNMTFGENVKRVREMRGLSQGELAHMVGFETRGAISKVEKNVVDPPQSMVKKLAKALNVSPLEFFDGYKTDYSKSPMQEFVPYLEQASAEKLSIIRKILDMPEEKKKSSSSIKTAN